MRTTNESKMTTGSNLNLAELKHEYYGYANGWTQTPERVRMAMNDPEAEIIRKTVGRCEIEFTCEKYKFSYRVDSSD